MTPSSENAIPSPLAAISLKLVGAITIAASLIDFLTLLLPPNFGERGWQIATITNLVDRGIVPLVGIALLLTGFWIDTSLGKSTRRNSLIADARFWVCLLSCLLGLVFLITTFIHPNNIRLQRKDDLAQVDTRAQQVTTELEGQLNAGLSQQRAQIEALLSADEAELQAALERGEIQQAQLDQLQQFRDNPTAVDDFLTSQITDTQTELQTRIAQERELETARVKSDAVKAVFRVTLSSLLLMVGYTWIGWVGLKRLLAMVG